MHSAHLPAICVSATGQLREATAPRGDRLAVSIGQCTNRQKCDRFSHLFGKEKKMNKRKNGQLVALCLGQKREV
ncbi:unnamed protein product [Protopolystoma xenopodis]|uniref:Uncharacterized protein n=1 Tax=Protopolystoma xenopodis TaxID=117903 RepID=A0A448XQ29_9PLAT|nr:unnamed protein product [Protopolystoma xenopodis]